MNVNPRVALVTGGNRGLGLEICRQLGRLEYKVILAARDKAKGEAAAELLRRDDLDVTWHALDVTKPASIAKIKSHIVDKIGRIDVLVNNAAVLLGENENILDLDAESFRASMEANVIGPLLLCQALVPLMFKSNYGRVVNVSSTAGQLSTMADYAPAYSMSKACLNALTRMISSQGKNGNVLVNSVCPGWVRTEMGGPSAPRSVEQGVDSIIWLATLPDDGPNGGFFQDRRKIPW